MLVCGKTFMSNCIAGELLKKGKTVLYQTAPVLLDTIIDNNLNNGDVFEEIQQEVFKDAQEGDLFEYINGEYKINK